MMIRDSLVLVESTSLKWRWRLINSILKSKDSMLRKVEDYTLNRLVCDLRTFHTVNINVPTKGVRIDLTIYIIF